VTATTTAPETAGSITVIDPHDGTTLARVATTNPLRATEAIGAAAAELPHWMRLAPAERGKALEGVADRLEAAAGGLAELVHDEVGIPVSDARAGVQAGVATLRQYAQLGPVHRGHSLRGDLYAADYTVTRPRGVALVLTPWNDPVAVACGLLGAALVTGNTVVHKPSERAVLVGDRLGQIVSAGLPEGVCHTLIGDASLGRALVADPRIGVIAHVGSTRAGRDIAARAATTGAHVIRENGGKDALVVDAGVDPRWAAQQAALGAFANAGQICTSVERILVHRQVADPFLEELVARAGAYGPPQRDQPLVDRRLREDVHGQVVAALTAGARLLTGGRIPDGPGSYYPPTVLADCHPSMEVMSQETFGPVAPVRVVDSFEEGLRVAADSEYGLAGTVLTGRLDHALRSVAELPVGTLKVNAVFGGAPGGSAQPLRASGSGFGYGPELLDEMTTTGVVHLAGAPRPADGEAS